MNNQFDSKGRQPPCDNDLQLDKHASRVVGQVMAGVGLLVITGVTVWLYYCTTQPVERIMVPSKPLILGFALVCLGVLSIFFGKRLDDVFEHNHHLKFSELLIIVLLIAGGLGSYVGMSHLFWLFDHRIHSAFD